MKTITKIFWCEKCALYVEPTLHDTTEKSDAFWGDSTWEAYIEQRCSLCTRLVEEVIACIACKAAQPESGADECTRCINTSERLVTNQTPAYLRSHATIEHEPEYQEKAA